MKLPIPLIFVFFSITFLYAQPGIQWQKCLGGSHDNFAKSIQQTADGGYIIAGSTNSNDSDVIGNHGNYDFWVVKLNPAGAIQWQKCLGGSQGEFAYSIQQTTDSGYIVAGVTGSNDNDVTGNLGGIYDCWVVKLNSVGAIQWQKCLGGDLDDGAISIHQTTDNGYIVGGYTYSNDSDVTGNHGLRDYWIVKLNSAGSIQWQKCLGGTGDDFAYSIQQTLDGGYIVAGRTNSNDSDVTGNHGNYDFWVIKLNPAGAIQWQKCLGGTGSEWAFSIQQTTDSGYIVAGRTNSNDSDVTGNHGGLNDYWVVKISSAGVIQWQKCLGGTGDDQPFSIQQTIDGGYIVAGETNSNDGDVNGNHGLGDYWVVKLNPAGAIQWQKCLGGTSSERAFSIQQITDGGYIVAGYTTSNDSDVTGNHGLRDYWIVKLSPSVGIDEIYNSISQFNIFPNPINQSTTISFSLIEKENTTLTIYDITGREVKFLQRSNLAPGEYSISWDLTDNKNKRVVDGFYLLTLSTEKEKLTKRIVVIK